MLKCPNCEIPLNEGCFTEVVTYLVPVHEENGIIIRDGNMTPLDDLITEPVFNCLECGHDFDVFLDDTQNLKYQEYLKSKLDPRD